MRNAKRDDNKYDIFYQIYIRHRSRSRTETISSGMIESVYACVLSVVKIQILYIPQCNNRMVGYDL